MASQATIDGRNAILKARGVPERFIDAIATRKGAGPLSNVFVLMLFMALCGGIAFIAIELPLAAPLIPIFYGRASSSLLFYAPHEVQLLTMFALIAALCVMVIVYFRIVQPKSARPYPAYDGEGETLRTLPPGQSMPMLMPDERFAGLGHLPDDAAFLDAARRLKRAERRPLWSKIAVLAWCGIVVIFIVGPDVLRATRFTTLTLSTVEAHRPGHVDTYPLSRVQYAEVLCRSGREYRFSYRLVYGEVVLDIWQTRDDLHRLDADGVLLRLVQLDRQLETMGVPIHRMGQTGSPRDDADACIRDMAKAWKLDDTRPLRQLVFGAGGGQP